MQSFVVFLAVLFGAAVANPMVLSPDDIKDQNRAISSTEYLKKIFQQDVMVSDTGLFDHKDLIAKMSELFLIGAIQIAQQVDLKQILAEKRLAGSTLTLFLPNDEAVAKWRQELPEGMRPDDEAMKRLVKAWIVRGMIATSRVTNNKVVTSYNGAKLRFNEYTDELKQKIITVNGAKIVKTELGTTGIIHVVDKVIFPLPIGDVIETLEDNPALSVIVDLIKKTDLAQSLKSANPVTVLVPSNAAFQALPEGVVDDLKKNPAKLEKVLKYHVIDDVRYSASLTSGTVLVASEGDRISVDIQDGKIRLNRERKDSVSDVIQADIPTTNGVVHIIDHVLIPRDDHFILA